MKARDQNSNGSQHTLTTEQLIEQASLDVLGLLEPHEREAFEAAFSTAPAHVQAHVRREQHRMARNDAMLPKVEPPASLRGRVLAAVRQAMLTSVGESMDASRLRFGPSSLPLWRAATIACATAAIVLGGATTLLVDKFREIDDYFQANRTQDLFRSSPRLKDLMFAQAQQRYAFVPTSDAFEGMGPTPQVILVIDPDTNSAMLMCRDLPAALGEYVLVRKDDQGRVVQELRPITVNAGEAYVSFSQFDMAVMDRLGIAANKPDSGEPPKVLMAVGDV